MPLGFTHDLLRPRTGDGSHRVSFVELFFDLVFVFAITQLSHGLIAHPDLATLVQTLILTLAVWWVWIDTTWCANWLDPERGPVRGLLIALMLLGLLMSSAIGEAFHDKALLFAGTLVAMQLGRSIFVMLALAKHRPDNYLNFVRITSWMCVSGVLWIAGALAPDELRLWVWLAAITLDCLGPVSRFYTPGLGATPLAVWDVSGEHMSERAALFVLIALGESIVVTGTVFAELELNGVTLLSFLAAFTSTVLLWLLYFSHGAAGGSRFISRASSTGPIARVAYTYIHIPLVLGIVLTAVADELVLAEPLGHTDSWTAGLVCGAGAVYLLGNLLFKRAVGSPWLISHLAGIVALGLLFAAHPLLSPLAMNWVSNAVFAAVVVAELVAYRGKLVAARP